MKLRPLHDRILVKRLEEEQVTKGGIIIPDSAKEKPIKGEVVAAGPGKVADDGKQIPMGVKTGDIVKILADFRLRCQNTPARIMVFAGKREAKPKPVSRGYGGYPPCPADREWCQRRPLPWEDEQNAGLANPLNFGLGRRRE